MRTILLSFIAFTLLIVPRFCHASYILDLDYACFRAVDTITYVEVYASVQRTNLIYQALDDSLSADFRVVLDIISNKTAVLSDTFWAHDVADTLGEQSLSGQFFSHVFRLMMLPGGYELRASLYQNDAEPRDIALDSLIVPFFGGDSLQISGLELGSRLEFKDDSSRFVKNGVLMIPNPTRFFGTQLPMFYYYAEIYNLDYDSSRTDSYTVTRRILDAESGSAVKPEVRKTRRVSGATAVIADGFPISTLKTGTYLFELAATCLRTGKMAVSRKKFWSYRREDYLVGRALLPEQRYNKRGQPIESNILDIVDVDSAFLWMRYVLTKEEQNRAERLTPEGKREFLHTCWHEREKEKPNAANHYFARVAEANRRYSFLKRPGWKTDRGRVFILYGEPNQTFRNYGTAEMPDHEIWQYDQLEGGSVFIFYDRSGFGDLDLVHSTKQGEINNPNWYKLSPTATQRQTGE